MIFKLELTCFILVINNMQLISNVNIGTYFCNLFFATHILSSRFKASRYVTMIVSIPIYISDTGSVTHALFEKCLISIVDLTLLRYSRPMLYGWQDEHISSGHMISHSNLALGSFLSCFVFVILTLFGSFARLY